MIQGQWGQHRSGGGFNLSAGAVAALVGVPLILIMFGGAIVTILTIIGACIGIGLLGAIVLVANHLYKDIVRSGHRNNWIAEQDRLSPTGRMEIGQTRTVTTSIESRERRHPSTR